MKKNLSDYIIAIIVVLCSAAVLAALTFALSERNPQADDRIVYIDFPDVSGIRLYSQVRYGGAQAGEVRAIRHLTPDERTESGVPTNTVRVAIALGSDVPPLPADVNVGLGSDTLLSEKFIALSGGDPEGPELEDKSILQGAPGLNFDRLASTAEDLLVSAGILIENLEPILENSDQLITEVRENLGSTMPKLDEFIASAQAVTGSADELIGHADDVLGDNEEAVAENLSKLKGALGNLDSLLGKTSGFVGSTDAQISERMDELQVVLENLKVITTYAKAITETLGERPSRLVWPSKRRDLPTEEEILRSEKPIDLRP